MFKKILLDTAEPLKLDEICSFELITEYAANRRIKLSYWEINKSKKDFLLGLIPETLRSSANLMCCSITGPGLAVPHVDRGLMSKINYYFSDDESITTFHKVNDSFRNIVYPGEKESRIYNLEDLVPTGLFRANKHETYILDVSKIHSVQILSSNTRWMLTYAFSDIPYDTLEACLS